MAYKIKWKLAAKISYADEVDFIYRKWNVLEVLKFEKLVDESILRIHKTPSIATYSRKRNAHKLVISKQSTLYFRVNEIEKCIVLLLFWNNKKSPKLLHKMMEQF